MKQIYLFYHNRFFSKTWQKKDTFGCKFWEMLIYISMMLEAFKLYRYLKKKYGIPLAMRMWEEVEKRRVAASEIKLKYLLGSMPVKEAADALDGLKFKGNFEAELLCQFKRDEYDRFWQKGNHYYEKVSDTRIRIFPSLPEARCPELFLHPNPCEIMVKDAAGKLFSTPDIKCVSDGNGGIEVFIETDKITGPFIEIVEPFSVKRQTESDNHRLHHSSYISFASDHNCALQHQTQTDFCLLRMSFETQKPN